MGLGCRPWIIFTICSSNDNLVLFLEPFKCYCDQLHSPGDTEALETLSMLPLGLTSKDTRPGLLSVTGWRAQFVAQGPADEVTVALGMGDRSPLDPADPGPGDLGAA